MSTMGEELIEAANEALEFLRGDETKGLSHTIIASDVDVKAIRANTGMTQEKFAQTYGLPLSTLKKWEAKISQPEAAAKAYLGVISQRPNVVKKALITAFS